jgi:hypothetical protein
MYVVIPVARVGARTGIHNPCVVNIAPLGGYGFRARGLCPRPGMTQTNNVQP